MAIHYDYIHRSAKGYLSAMGSEADVGTIVEGQVQEYINQKFKMKLDTNLEARRAKVEQIEKSYQEKLFGPGINANGANIQDILQKALQTNLQNHFREKSGQVDIDNLASVIVAGGTSAPYLEALKDTLQNTLKKITNKEKITTGRLQRISQEIKTRIDTIAKDHDSLASLQADFEKTNMDFENFRREIESLAAELEVGGTNFIKFPTSENGVTLQALNDMINLIGDNNPLLAANQSGMVGEWIIPMLNYSVIDGLEKAHADMTDEVKSQLIKDIAGIMQEFNLGGTTVTMVINKRGQIIRESKAHKKGEGNMVLSQQEKNKGYKIIHRTNKTDAMFYADADKTHREDISVKNYGSLSGITLVSNTPLNFVISQLGRGVSHHVRNILAMHYPDDNLIVGYREQVNAQIIKLILCFALVGYSDQNRPSIFMVISNKKVYCYDMDSLLANLVQAEISNGRYSIGYGGKTASISFNSSWKLNSAVPQDMNAKTPEQRVSSTLENFDAQKIHATLSIHLSA